MPLAHPPTVMPDTTALRAVLAAGFVPLAVIPRHIANGAPKETTLPEGMQTAVANFVFVLPSHPCAARPARLRLDGIPLVGHWTENAGCTAYQRSSTAGICDAPVSR